MKKHLLALALVVFAMASAVAQRAITGKVTDKSGGPLIGASILVKGTSSGSVTDVDGTYSLNAPDGATTLVVSYTGYSTQEITLGTSNIIDVMLEESASQLGEVVVTAQGIRREKKALGYAVSTVDAGSLEDRPQADVARVIQGKVPGVNVTATSGVSGTGTNITIRGYSSITGSVQPLFVVDGVPFNSNTNQRGGFTQGGQGASSRFLDLDPNNIESISVLKGLAATVTYGDQGRNGVILVTTKSGSKKSRKAEFNLTQSYFTNTAHLPRYQNDYVGGFQQNLGYFFSNWGPTLNEARTYPSQNTNTALTQHPYAFLSNAALRAGQADYVASVQPYAMQVFPNNVSDFFRTGAIANTSLNVTGGSENISYNLSAGYLNEQGYIPENGLKKLNLGLGINAKLSKKLSVNTSFTFANTDQYSPPLSSGTGNNANDFPSVLANVMYTPRQVDLMGWPYADPVSGASVYFRSGNDIPNPRWVLENYKTTGSVNRIFSATTFNYEIAKNFNLLYKAGLDTYTEDQEFQLNQGGVQFPTGAYFTRNIQNTIWDNSLILSFSTKPLFEKLTIAARLGGNLRNDVFSSDGVSSQNQLARNLFRHTNFIDNVASDFIEEQTRMGIFGEVTLDYNNFLYLNFAGRNDWTSTVEKENRRIFYPSTSISFVPTSAFAGLDGGFLNFLKIRAGVGTSAGFPSPYNTRNVLNQGARSWLNAAGAALQSHAVTNVLGNPNLKPELHTEYEGGIEAKFFNNRLGFDLTVYRRDTRDLITSSPLDASTGYTSTTINIGKIRNEGIELSVNIVPVKTKNFNWDVTINYSRNTPKVLDLGGTLTEVQTTGFTGLGNFAIVGKPYNIIKGSGVRRNEQGQPLIDGGGYLQATATPIVLGDPNPAFNMSLINGLTYKGFSFDFMLSYRHGGAIYSSTAGALMGRGLTEDTGLSNGYDRAQTYLFPGVKADGTPNDIQVTASDVGFNNLYFFVDEGRIYDGTTIRLQEVNLTYALPTKLLSKTPFKAISLGISGTNLWYRAPNFPPGLNFDTDNLGLGVGNGLGFEFLTGPSARRIGGTLKMTF